MKHIVISTLLVIVGLTSITAEPLYTLVSPNEEQGGSFGFSVSGAGDVNGNGHDDVVVGAHREGPGASPLEAGRAYVFDGQAGNLLHTFVSPNEEEAGWFGYSISGAGDVNGDGYDDIVVGAYKEEPGISPDWAGRAYVFGGHTGSLLYTLASPNEEEWGYFGYSVSDAGDVNGDGYDDVVVGAPWEDPGTSPDWAGRAYVFDGQAGSLLHTLVSPNEHQWGNFGYCVSGAGDVNGDGNDDIVVGARWESSVSSPPYAGRAYVFDGLTGAPLHTLVSPNEEAYGFFGSSVSGAGDVNGDEYDDIVVGAHREYIGTSSPQHAGRGYIFDGQTGIPLYTLVSPDEEFLGEFGISVSGAGDVNGDGHGDVVVGAWGDSPGASPQWAGGAYVFDGLTGIMLHTLVSPNAESQGRFGCSVSGAGDVNGDGYDDVVVGAYSEDPGATPVAAGRAYVFGWMHLSAELAGDELVLQWSTWSPASEYWVYGTGNEPWFEPDTSPPTYVNRVAVVPPETTTWSSSAGLGDPDENWTYLVIAVDDVNQEIVRSARAGEHDFQTDVP